MKFKGEIMSRWLPWLATLTNSIDVVHFKLPDLNSTVNGSFFTAILEDSSWTTVDVGDYKKRRVTIGEFFQGHFKGNWTTFGRSDVFGISH